MKRHLLIAACIVALFASFGCRKKVQIPERPISELVDDFYQAAKNGDVATVKAMLDRYPELADARENSMFELTALHGAAYKGEVEVARLLISRGADVNARASDGNTPLVEAATHNRLDMVKLLLDSGADVNAANDRGDIPLHWAAARGNQEVVRLMILKGADVNARNNDGNTPLGLAVSKGHEEMTEMLRQSGGIE